MSEPKTPPAEMENGEPQSARSSRRVRPWMILTALAVVLIAAACYWSNSPFIENLARKALIEQLQSATGGRVEIRAFHWRPFHLEAQAEGVVIHGREAKGEAPYAAIDRLDAQASIANLWTPRLTLRLLQIDHPVVHLIVYRDGTTNQPQPRHILRKKKSGLDTLFAMQAGRLAISQGEFNLDSRADEIDFQNRLAPLDLDAADVALHLDYRESVGKTPESYHIEAAAANLHLLRGGGQRWAESEQGRIEASLDLTRNALYLRSFRISALRRTLGVTGEVVNFQKPRWQAAVNGELDLRIVEPITGYPRTPEGVIRLNLAAAGENGLFRCDGVAHVENGAYIDSNVSARDFNLDARLHFDPWRLAISSIVVRPRSGGQMTGEVNLAHWLTHAPGGAELLPAQPQPLKRGKKNTAPAKSAPSPAPLPLSREGTPIHLPIDGEVKANFQGVTLDTLLDWLSGPHYRRLGIDAQVNGPAWAQWAHGDDHTLQIGANFKLSPSGRAQPGEAPATGALDGVYTHKDGAVNVRLLEALLPATQLRARGRMNVDPVEAPSALMVDFHSTNLGELDAVLRDLGMERKGKKGAAALPISLAGAGEFHGVWNGSLIDPHLIGNAQASDLSIEAPTDKNPTQTIHWDTITATGSYAANRVAIDHAQLRRGAAEIELEGVLSSPPARSNHSSLPSFGAASLLHMRLRAAKVGVADLQPFVERPIPATGQISAQLDTDGPLRALNAAGWVELENGSLCGEPVSRIRAQGRLSNQLLTLSQISLSGLAGGLAVNGSYDLRTDQFQAHVKGAGVDLARIEMLHRKIPSLSGRLNFTLDGEGSLSDPRLTAQATVEKLAIQGEPLGAVTFSGHTADRTFFYHAASRMEAARLEIDGKTAFADGKATSAKIGFSQFNIDPLLRAARIPGLNGESSLAGTAFVEGPLAHPEQMRGDIRLQQMAVTLDGVHLHSENGLHAALGGGRIALDPLRITGENTSLTLSGSLSLQDQKQMSISAAGEFNLKLIETLDPDLTASGSASFQLEARGALQNPDLKGRLEFHDGALAFEDLPNGLSQIHGALEFNRNRLEVRSLTAMTGGGQLNLSGYLAYQHGLYADLAATGMGVRIRYPQGVSSLADLSLRLQGPQNNLLLSGNVQLTRFSVSKDFDVAALVSQSNAVRPAPRPEAPSNHVRLDIHLGSSPQLSFQNAYAKLAGNLDLRVRGTLASPSLLGHITVSEGSAMIAGTRYELQHGDISFTNPVRIQPNINLNASARVEDYDIALGVHGTPEKLSVSYRSDPPLPEADVVALLALGRTQSQQRLYTQQQEQALSNPAADALLGGALNATVSSRVQKLFGAGSVKVDPNHLGAMGASTSRIIVEEQLGPYVALSYATNTNSTAQQLLQAEVAINRHVSAVVSRDESGVFSVVLKVTRRYR